MKTIEEIKHARAKQLAKDTICDAGHATYPGVGEFRDRKNAGNPDDTEDRDDEEEPPGDDGDIQQEVIELGDLHGRSAYQICDIMMNSNAQDVQTRGVEEPQPKGVYEAWQQA